LFEFECRSLIWGLGTILNQALAKSVILKRVAKISQLRLAPNFGIFSQLAHLHGNKLRAHLQKGTITSLTWSSRLALIMHSPLMALGPVRQDGAEQPVRFVVYPVRKVEGVGIAVITANSEIRGPKMSLAIN